jgi:ATP-dependent DNA ligase
MTMLALPSPYDISDGRFDDWIAQVKLDGVRMSIVSDTTGDVKFYTRNGIDVTDKCMMIKRYFQVSARIPPDSIFDAEFGYVEDSYPLNYAPGKYTIYPKINFEKTVGWINEKPTVAVSLKKMDGLSVHIFDTPRYLGVDTSKYPLVARIELLNYLDQADLSHPKHVAVALNSVEGIYREALLDNVYRVGGEGIILKNPHSHYISGRKANTWYKFKKTHTYDVVVTGSVPGRGKYSGVIGALEYSAMDSTGHLVYVGKCSGMTDTQRVAFTDELPKIIEIECNGLVGASTSPGGVEYSTPRHARFIRERTDKRAFECPLTQFTK